MNAAEIRDALAAPFEAKEVRWKPQAISGSRALAVCYIDARAVMDRLDDVFGVAGWQDAYQPLAEGTVLCRLRVLIEGLWVEKQDVGGESEQKDGGDRAKAAFSDALKRAAVKVGVGRYIYSLPLQWVDYDPQKKQFTRTPQLPAWALPKQRGAASISDAEAGELARLIERAGSDAEGKFFKVYNLKSLYDLPADKFSEAVMRLDKFIAAKAKASGEPAA